MCSLRGTRKQENVCVRERLKDTKLWYAEQLQVLPPICVFLQVCASYNGVCVCVRRWSQCVNISISRERSSLWCHCVQNINMHELINIHACSFPLEVYFKLFLISVSSVFFLCLITSSEVTLNCHFFISLLCVVSFGRVSSACDQPRVYGYPSILAWRGGDCVYRLFE